jgi:hypothetical protein
MPVFLKVISFFRKDYLLVLMAKVEPYKEAFFLVTSIYDPRGSEHDAFVDSLKEIASVKGVVEAQELRGVYDAICKVRYKSDQEFDSIKKGIRSVDSVHSALYMKIDPRSMLR